MIFHKSQIIPKVLYSIESIHNKIEFKKREMQIFDSAIAEIETNFGSVLFSANVFDQDDHNAQ